MKNLIFLIIITIGLISYATSLELFHCYSSDLVSNDSYSLDYLKRQFDYLLRDEKKIYFVFGNMVVSSYLPYIEEKNHKLRFVSHNFFELKRHDQDDIEVISHIYDVKQKRTKEIYTTNLRGYWHYNGEYRENDLKINYLKFGNEIAFEKGESVEIPYYLKEFDTEFKCRYIEVIDNVDKILIFRQDILEDGKSEIFIKLIDQIKNETISNIIDNEYLNFEWLSKSVYYLSKNKYF